MAILKGILEDSWDHYRRLDKKIDRRLKALPNGSIYKRRLGKNSYYYLSVREGGKVQSKYLGKVLPAQIEKGIKERRILEIQKKDVRRNLKLLVRTLKKKSHA